MKKLFNAILLAVVIVTSLPPRIYFFETDEGSYVIYLNFERTEIIDVFDVNNSCFIGR